jgi:hypothetical protein
MPALLTHRRDHREFKRSPKPLPCGDQLIGGIVFCGSKEGRDNWVRLLSQRHPSRFNYFVFFRDVQSPWALQFGFADWAFPRISIQY